MKVSVILCTYNRCQYLRDVLDSLTRSVLPPTVEWEVLVVDNNSSDETPVVVNEFLDRFPGHFRCILEPRQGKSVALNTGVRESRGDILAFLDDDVTVEPTWLWSLTKVLENGEWAGTGGRTLLAEKFLPPPWLSLSGPHSLGGVLAAQFDLGDKPCELSDPPYGANMAFRRQMFEKFGFFRTDMGPSADGVIPRPNEDTEFGRRLMAAGERLIYEPGAVVYHPVSRHRLRKDYFLKWWFDYGRASILEIGRRPDIFGVQRRYWAIGKIACVVLTERTLRWILSWDPSKRFFCKCFVWMTAGQIAEIYRHWGPVDTYGVKKAKAICKAKS